MPFVHNNFFRVFETICEKTQKNSIKKVAISMSIEFSFLTLQVVDGFDIKLYKGK